VEDLVNRPATLFSITCSVAASCGGDLCDAVELSDTLASSSPGDTVTVGNCIVSGNFVVPKGVTLTGLGSSKSRLKSTSGSDPLLLLETAANETTRVQDLSLESLGRAGVLARGDGAIELSSLALTVARGIGIGAGAIASARLTGVSLLGPVTQQNASFLPEVVTATDSATFGVAFAETEVELTGVDVRGFGSAGAAFIAADASWQDGTLEDNFPIGIYASEGALALDGLEVCRTIQGARPSAFGGFFSQADVATSGMTVCENEGYGLFHLGRAASHLALDAGGNNHAAVWGQSMSSLSVEGTITDNSFAGIVAASVMRVEVRNTTVSSTRIIRKIFDTYGARFVGDGIQLVYPIADATLEDVTLAGNQRVGLLIDLGGGSLANLAFDGVSATVTSTVQGGVVLQNGAAPATWDSGVTRNGTTDAADRAFQRQETVGVVGPCDYPRALDASLVSP
jgi:hypothetical protein